MKGLDLGVNSKVYAAGVAPQTISALADVVGLTADTLRYYEREGLLPPAERSPAGYRLYGPEAAERLRFIKQAQRMGLRLADIKELLDVRDKGLCPCGHTKALVERRLAEVDAEIAQLRQMRRKLVELSERNGRCLDVSGATWSCRVGLENVRFEQRPRRKGGDR
jgi:DNA-binding transcriptional MerR regulator